MVRNPSIDGRFDDGRCGAANRPPTIDSRVARKTCEFPPISHVALDKHTGTQYARGVMANDSIRYDARADYDFVIEEA